VSRAAVPLNEGTLLSPGVSTRLLLSDNEFYLCNRASVENAFMIQARLPAFKSMRKPDAIA